MDIKSSIFQAMTENVIKRIESLPDALLVDELDSLVQKIKESRVKAERTIKPVRLLVTIDAMILLQGGDKLEMQPDGSNPKYDGLIVHPCIFPNTDIEPFQFHILG
jgi:hypothetical protein